MGAPDAAPLGAPPLAVVADVPAGHGATEKDVMSPDGDGLEKYLLPYDANPEDLYATHLGSDFVEEGRNAARVMADLLGGVGNIVEITGTEDKIEGLVELLSPLGILEMVRTGQVAMMRGSDRAAAPAAARILGAMCSRIV